MATTSISLVREQSERVQPTRALWVSFPLGRPLGVPGDAAFQLDVIRRALGLLETATEPTIVDHPVDAPDAGPEPWACPLSLPVTTSDSLEQRLLAEIARLRPWAAETRRARGRTLFGASGAGVDDVDAVARALAAVATTGDLSVPPESDVAWSHSMPVLVRHLADDLRGWYHEAIAAQPGPTPPDHDALNDWIFGSTVFGETLLSVGDVLTAAGEHDPMALLVRGLVIPEGRYRGVSNFDGVAGYEREV